VDPANLTDVKIAFFPDSISHTYDFCIKSIVPLTTAPNPVVATGTYGTDLEQPDAPSRERHQRLCRAKRPIPPEWESDDDAGKRHLRGRWFTYTTGGSFQAPNNGPGSFPAVISGWGPGHDGIQFYGPYKGGKQISQLTSVKSSWSFTMGSTGDAVYDVWFSNSSATPPVPGIELMIWIGNTGKNPGSAAWPAPVPLSQGGPRTSEPMERENPSSVIGSRRLGRPAYPISTCCPTSRTRQATATPG
jgi:hypothetical protein